MLKKFTCLVLAATMCMILGVGGTALADGAPAARAATISLNGKQVESVALVRSGTIYLPVRNLCENLGYTVQWDNADGRKTVATTLNGETVTLDITNQTITQDGTKAPMTGDYSGDGCILEDGRTYLESALFSAAYGVNMKYDEQNGAITMNRVIDKDTTNTLEVGDTACVMLNGNPTTGYGWYLTIGDDGIIAKADENYVSDSESDQTVGAGGTYTWTFKALAKGETTITFRYYRSWMGEDSATAENTITYRIIVA